MDDDDSRRDGRLNPAGREPGREADFAIYQGAGFRRQLLDRLGGDGGTVARPAALAASG
jgi:hypothetical protein